MKRFFALFFAFVMLVSLPTNALATEVSTQQSDANVLAIGNENQASRANDTYILTTYYDYDFYASSLIKRVNLSADCISITYRCTVNNGQTDLMYLIITDLNGRGYNRQIELTVDDLSHSMYLYLPAGNYNVYITGSVSVYHTRVAVNFYAWA